MSTQDDLKLIQDCVTIKGAIEESMNWVTANVEPDKKGVTVYNLKKFKRFANRFQNAVPKRPSIAIFGQSQVGKSYLVSNLAKTPEAFSLDVVVPGQNEVVDFIEKINPPGGGKEATGLVSRFTVVDNFQAGDQPYAIRLFSQADVVKIIANGYLSDITHYYYTINRTEIQTKLQAVARKLAPMPVPGFDEDDVYEVKEYLNHKFRDHFIIKDLNNINFWEDIAAIVPFVDSEQRWEVLEILWGKQIFFTELFKKLSFGLKQVNFLPEVRCELAALTPQLDTILDVERLRELYRENVNKPPVNLYNGGSKICTLDRSILSALTAEVILPLPKETANHPLRTFLKDADILDFPGARSRQQIPEDTFVAKENDDKLLVYLRGKVAFLFDRYTFNNEISTLLFCMDDKQPEVADLPKFLYEWIKTTHGGSPEKREEREQKLAQLVTNKDIDRLIPILVVFTKFNIELAGNPATEKPGELGPHNAKWKARFGANFADQMSIAVGDNWIQRWNTKGPFKNLFLLRDLKWSKAIYDGYVETGKETNIKADYVPKMKDMQSSFISHPDVSSLFHKPAEAWEEATGLNNSGINYIVKYLTPTCDPIIKREQISSQIAELKQEIYHELSAFYQGGNIKEKMAKARINAAQVFMSLMKMQKENNSFGNFLDKLVISDDLSWKIYFDLMMNKQIDLPQQTQQKSQGGKVIPVDLLELLKQFITIEKDEAADSILNKLKNYFGIDDIDSLSKILEETGVDIRALIEAKQSPRPEEKMDRAYVFAGNLLSKWLENIENIKADEVLLHLGLQKKIADLIVKELNKNKNRVNLKKFIADSTREHIETFQLTSNIDIVARISANILNTFINTVGYVYQPENERPKVKEEDTVAVFSQKNISAPKKKEIKLGIEFPGERFFVEWTTAMRSSFEANVYFEENVKDAQRAEADAKLGSILEKVK